MVFENVIKSWNKKHALSINELLPELLLRGLDGTETRETPVRLNRCVLFRST